MAEERQFDCPGCDSSFVLTTGALGLMGPVCWFEVMTCIHCQTLQSVRHDYEKPRKRPARCRQCRKEMKPWGPPVRVEDETEPHSLAGNWVSKDDVIGGACPKCGHVFEDEDVVWVATLD